MVRRVLRSNRTIALALCILTLVGCDGKPRAPALEDGAVYQNAQEGFRFLVPTGWRQRAKTDVPRGQFATEQMLVQYVGQSAKGATLLEASLVDLPPTSDVAVFLAAPSQGSERWEPGEKPEDVDINGVSATRYLLHGRHGNLRVSKEVVVFRRGERLYFLTGVFPSADAQARGQVRKAEESVIWKNR